MSSINVTIGISKPFDALSLPLLFAALCIVYYITSTFYDVYYGPLSKYPGPKSWAFSKIPRTLVLVAGEDHIKFAELHQKYGSVVRIGPQELSYAGGASSWKDIYGFKKHGNPHPYKDPMFYGKSLNGVDSAITADDANHARQRKILAHAFSDKALKDQEPLLKKWAELMKKKLGERADGKDKADMLKYYNCTTFDVMGEISLVQFIERSLLTPGRR